MHDTTGGGGIRSSGAGNTAVGTSGYTGIRVRFGECGTADIVFPSREYHRANFLCML